MSVGVMLEVFEIVIKLRDGFAQEPEHIALYIGVGILVDGQPAGGVLRKENAETLALIFKAGFDFARDLDHLFAVM